MQERGQAMEILLVVWIRRIVYEDLQVAFFRIDPGGSVPSGCRGFLGCVPVLLPELHGQVGDGLGGRDGNCLSSQDGARRGFQQALPEFGLVGCFP